MSPRSEYPCCECDLLHPRQAFISHAAKDTKIAKEAAKACCAAKVKPYLFEYSAEFTQHTTDNAKTIAGAIINSQIFLVVLSPSVSEAYWTQAWIGFEIGVSIGADIASNNLEQGNYFSGRIIVLQDIHQVIKVSVPQVHDLLLFDFRRTWSDTQDLLKFILTYIYEPDGELFRLGNNLRLRMMTAKAKCENKICNAVYNVVIPTEDTDRLGFRVWWNRIHSRRIRWIKKGIRASCSLKCPSCGQKVICKLSRSL